METLTHGWRTDLNIQRLGYFRTDDETTARITNALRPAELADGEVVCMLDPCCGEGIAELHIAHALGAVTFGVEYDEDRYQKACSRLDHTLNADALSGTVTSQAWASVILFNPPYGDAPKSDEKEAAKRLEALFWERWAAKLKRGGVMVAILPTTLFHRSRGIVRAMSHFFSGQRVEIYRAVDPTYKQVVIIGYRRSKSDETEPNYKLKSDLLKIASDELEVPVIPERLAEPFIVPASRLPDQWDAVVLSESMVRAAMAAEDGSAIAQIEAELAMSQHRYTQNRSVVPLRQGHIPQLLAAGGLDGILQDQDATLLVKGAVRRVGSQETTTEQQISDRGSSERKTTTTIYKWETVIYALDITKGRSCGLFRIEKKPAANSATDDHQKESA